MNSPQDQNPLKVSVDEAIKRLTDCLADGSKLAEGIKGAEQQLQGDTAEIFDIGPLQNRHRSWQNLAVTCFRDIYHNQYYEQRFLDEYDVNERIQRETYDEFKNSRDMLDKIEQNRNEAILRKGKAEIAFEEKFGKKIEEKDIDELLNEHGLDGDFVATIIKKMEAPGKEKDTDPIELVKSALSNKELRTIVFKNGDRGVLGPCTYPNERDIIRSQWIAQLGNKLENLESSLGSGIKFVKARVVFLSAFGSDPRLILLEPLIELTHRRILVKLKNVYDIEISEMTRAKDWLDDMVWAVQEKEGDFSAAKKAQAKKELYYPPRPTIEINPWQLEKQGFRNLRDFIIETKEEFSIRFLSIFGFGPDGVLKKWLNEPPVYEYTDDNLCYDKLSDYISDFIVDVKSLPYRVKTFQNEKETAFHRCLTDIEREFIEILPEEYFQKVQGESPTIKKIDRLIKKYPRALERLWNLRSEYSEEEAHIERIEVKSTLMPLSEFSDSHIAVRGIWAKLSKVVDTQLIEPPSYRKIVFCEYTPDEAESGSTVMMDSEGNPVANTIRTACLADMKHLENEVNNGIETVRELMQIGPHCLKRDMPTSKREAKYVEGLKAPSQVDSPGAEAIISLKEEIEKIPSIVSEHISKLHEATQKQMTQGEGEEDKEPFQEIQKAENVFSRSSTGFVVKFQNGDDIPYPNLAGLFYIWACFDHTMKAISEKELIEKRIEHSQDQSESRASDAVRPYEKKYLENISGGGVKDPESIQETIRNYTTAIVKMEADKKKALEENNNVEADSLERDIKKIKAERAKLRNKYDRPISDIDDPDDSRRIIYAALDYAYKKMESNQPELAAHLRKHLIRERGLRYTGNLEWETR